MISFDCTNPECGKQVKAPDGSEGKKARCPHCKTIQDIPITTAIEEDDDLYDFSDAEAGVADPPVAPEAEAPVVRPAPLAPGSQEMLRGKRECQVCHAPMTPRETICPKCGLDQEKGSFLDWIRRNIVVASAAGLVLLMLLVWLALCFPTRLKLQNKADDIKERIWSRGYDVRNVEMELPLLLFSTPDHVKVLVKGSEVAPGPGAGTRSKEFRAWFVLDVESDCLLEGVFLKEESSGSTRTITTDMSGGRDAVYVFRHGVLDATRGAKAFELKKLSRK